MFKPQSLPVLCTSALTPSATALYPSQLEPVQGCCLVALPASCEMLLTVPVVWISHLLKETTESPACPVNCSPAFLPPWMFSPLRCNFLLRAATALLFSDATAVSMSRSLSYWVHFCMAPLAMALRSHIIMMLQNLLYAHPQHLKYEGVGLLHQGSLDVDEARRDGLMFQTFPACGSKHVMNQEWEKCADQFQDYVVGHWS